MASANSENLYKLKIKEARKLFFISNELLNTAKKLAKYQVKECELGAKYALSLSKIAINKDVEAVRKFEINFINQAKKRNSKYKKNIENFLSGVHENISPEVEKLLEKTRRSLNLWLEKSANGVAYSGGEFSKIIGDVSLSGAKILSHGHQTVDQLVNGVEKSLLKKPKSQKANKAPRVPAAIVNNKINVLSKRPELLNSNSHSNGRQQDSI